jgi:UPF0755 protein
MEKIKDKHEAARTQDAGGRPAACRRGAATVVVRSLVFLALVLLAALLGFGYMREELIRWAFSTRTLSQPCEVVLEQRASLGAFAKALEAAGVVDSAFRFYAFVRFFDSYRRFQAGRYRFSEAVAPYTIAETVRAGRIYVPLVLQVTIPEGFTLVKTAERLERAGVGSKAEALALAKDRGFLAEHKIDAPGIEGYLYPATYNFSKVPALREVFAAMIANFHRELPSDYATRAQGLGLTVHQAVIFASLVELESALPEERKLVAGVIWNRLKRRMPLAIDASIIYGLAAYDGNLRFRDLRDESNPYNTRVYAGLPPSPICSPSRESLLAVLEPTASDYLYYVLDPNLEKQHHFSKTLAEHNRYVQKLKRAR